MPPPARDGVARMETDTNGPKPAGRRRSTTQRGSTPDHRLVDVRRSEHPGMAYVAMVRTSPGSGRSMPPRLAMPGVIAVVTW